MTPNRIILVLPCCIGDVVMATAALRAVRRAYPQAHIAWLVGSWSKGVLEGHDLLDNVVDSGADALPVRSPAGMMRIVQLLRRGQYDLLISFVRSPLMSIAALLSGIPQRAGIDSAGRGFGYQVRASIDPNSVRHEADIYLDVIAALGIDTAGCYCHVPVPAAARGLMRRHGIHNSYIVVNPAGGRNPGMQMDVKRYPPRQMAVLAERLAAAMQSHLVLLAGPNDGEIVAAVQSELGITPTVFQGVLSFAEIAALAAESALYVGNDTGLTHFAAAAGARAVMIMGPTDPRRYAPYTPRALALWRPAEVPARGVAAGAPAFEWSRDGISPEEAEAAILGWLKSADDA